MQIDIDINFLIENNITANQYLILYLLTSKKLSYLSKYNEIDPIDIEDINSLVKNGLVHYPPNETDVDFNKILVRSKFRDLVVEKDFFDDFFDIFPTKVTRPDGKNDYLRTTSEKARKLYTEQTLNKKINHDKILQCLKYEIMIREREGSMPYMKKMINWLENQEWLSWQERLQDEPVFVTGQPTKTLGYGQELI